MIHEFVNFITEYRQYAPWMAFSCCLLAGLGIPISIDVILVINAFLAATTLPEYAVQLYLSVLLGCYFSAWIAYWLGRRVGIKLQKFSLFSKLLSNTRLTKMKQFYEKYGLLTLIVGRFIPFGVRNCLFVSTGMSKVHFGKFILKDAIACSLWTTVCFYLFYSLGLNYQVLLHYVKTFNIIVFITFALAVIGTVWYRKRKRVT